MNGNGNGKLDKIKTGVVFKVLLVVLILIAFYYFFYQVPQREKELSQRYLRLVSMMSEQFENRGKNIRTVICSEIENILTDFKRYEKDRGLMIDRIQDHPLYNHQPNRVFGDITVKGASKERISGTYLVLFLKASLDRIPNLDAQYVLEGEEQGIEKFIPGDLSYQLDISYKKEQKAVIFTVTFFNSEKEKFPYLIRAAMNIDYFVEHMFKGTDFGEVFVFDDKKDVIYRWHQSDDEGIKSSLQVLNFSSLLNGVQSPGKEKKGDGKTESTSGQPAVHSTIFDMDIAGIGYKLFLQPIPLEFVSEGSKDWFIGGLLPADTFGQRSRKISLTVMMALFFLLFLLLVSYPAVKLLFIDRTDRLQVRDVVLAVVSFSIAVPMVIFLLVTAPHYFNTYDTSLKLKRLSTQIQENFENEIEAAYQQLLILTNEKRYLLRKDPGAHGNDTAEEKNEQELDNPKGQDILRYLVDDQEHLIYPFFDMVFIMGKSGKQTYKGVVNNDHISFHDVSKREYFKKIRDQEYWFTPSGNKMMLEAVYSKTTGIYELNISLPLQEQGASAEAGIFAGGMSFRPLSLLHPVLPYGYAFAIIDTKGKVLFHSDKRLNAYENFFIACKDPGALQAAVFSRDACRTVVDYHEKRWDVLLKPINNTPWNIVVLKNRDTGTALFPVNIMVASLDHFVYLGFLALLLGCFQFLHFIRKKLSTKGNNNNNGKFILLWPNEKLHPKYAEMALLNLAIFAGLIIHLLLGEQPVYYLALPIIVLIFAFGTIIRIKYKDSSTGTSILSHIPPGIFSVVVLPISVALLLYLAEKGIYSGPWIMGIVFLVPLLCYLVVLTIPEKFEKKWLKYQFFRRCSFHLFLYSFLLLALVYPALYMVLNTRSDIQEVSLKHDQLQLARQVADWEKELKIDYKDLKRNFEAKEFIDIIKQGKDYCFTSEPLDTIVITSEKDLAKIRALSWQMGLYTHSPLDIIYDEIEKDIKQGHNRGIKKK